jgi:hypothetical protein
MSQNQNTEPQWQFENDTDKELGIETITYPNGARSKRCKLSDGKEVVTRMLKGKDAKDIQRLTDKDAEKFQHAIIAVSTKIDDKAIVIEELDELWYADYTKILAMASINFPTTQSA